MGPRVRSVAVGAAVALALALPATLVAQILDATSDDGIGDVPLLLLSAVVLAGSAVGGSVVARRDVEPRAPLAAATGLIAMTLVQVLGVARLIVSDEDVDWGVVPGVLLLGSAVAALAATVSRRRPLP